MELRCWMFVQETKWKQHEQIMICVGFDGFDPSLYETIKKKHMTDVHLQDAWNMLVGTLACGIWLCPSWGVSKIAFKCQLQNLDGSIRNKPFQKSQLEEQDCFATALVTQTATGDVIEQYRHRIRNHFYVSNIPWSSWSSSVSQAWTSRTFIDVFPMKNLLKLGGSFACFHYLMVNLGANGKIMARRLAWWIILSHLARKGRETERKRPVQVHDMNQGRMLL